MKEKGNIDPTLRALGGRWGRYQTLQCLVINIGAFGAAYQLLDNIFIGRTVLGQQCAELANDSVRGTELETVDWWNSSHVAYGECEITVYYGNLSEKNDQHYDCPNGYSFAYHPDLSFRTEFDLVCDRKLLGSLVQTLVIIGQGIGAVLSAIVSDRFGRKRTLIGSQGGLLLVGMAIGLAPSYPVLAVLKFIIGGFQQGVVTGMATMSIELYPMESRSLQVMVGSVLWGMGSSSMTLFAFLLREHSWRYLQYTLSGVSLIICLLQLWYLDESLRWLVANGRKHAVVRVLERAARVNCKDLNQVLQSLQDSDTDAKTDANGTAKTQPDISGGHVNLGFSSSTTDLNSTEKEKPDFNTENQSNNEKEKQGERRDTSTDTALSSVDKTLSAKQTDKLSLRDIFRHRHLLKYAFVVWLAWFTCAFAFFSLYMMSATLHGNRFLNYFLTALMELPAGFLLYYLVDKFGRKTATRVFCITAGVGLVGSGVFGIFKDNSVMAALSVGTAMIGMLGASSFFGAVFFFTPEVFPTNMRNQALGLSSFAGRLGGMLGPFMADLAAVAIWAPGAMIGTLAFLVAILFRFVPETKGRELPHTIEDIKSWDTTPRKTQQKADTSRL